MSFLDTLQSHLPLDLRKRFLQLKTPFAIHEYLDSMPYIGEEGDRAPRNVMLDGQCHCLDGGFFAALVLWRISFKLLAKRLSPVTDRVYAVETLHTNLQESLGNRSS